MEELCEIHEEAFRRCVLLGPESILGGNITVDQAASTYQDVITKWRGLHADEIANYESWVASLVAPEAFRVDLRRGGRPPGPVSKHQARVQS